MKSILHTKLFLYIIFTVTLLTFNSCFITKTTQTPVDHTSVNQTSTTERRITEENKVVPPEFGNSNTFLICVLKDIKLYDKYLKKRTKKNYNGSYIFLKQDDLKNEIYNDKKVYRYIFDHSKRTYMTSNGAQYKRFFVYDRLKEKKYQLKTEFTFFANAIETYMKRLEVKRLNSLTVNSSNK